MADPKCSYIGSNDITEEQRESLNEEFDGRGITKCKRLMDCASLLNDKAEQLQTIVTRITNLVNKPEVSNAISVLTNGVYDNRSFSSLAFTFVSDGTSFTNDFQESIRVKEYMGSYVIPSVGITEFTKKFKGGTAYGVKPTEFDNVKEYIRELYRLIKAGADEYSATIPELLEVLEELKLLDVTYGPLNDQLRTARGCADDIYDIGLEYISDVQSTKVAQLGDRDLIKRLASGDKVAQADATKIIGQMKDNADTNLGNFAVVDKAIYQEQCFLLSQISKLVKFKKSASVPVLPYIGGNSTNAPINIQDEPFGFINRLTQSPNNFPLLDLKTSQISSLVPTIRLYRISTDPATGKDTGLTEVTFDTNPAVMSYAADVSYEEDGSFNYIAKSALDLFKDKRKRGMGVGLRSFDFTLHGSDPFAVKKAIEASLTIFATSFSDLVADRVGTTGEPYRFADLALKTGSTTKQRQKATSLAQRENLDKLNFRLKAVVGWAIPRTNVDDFSAPERDSVNDAFLTLNLTPTIHEFDFDEAGGVTMKIDYLAYIEDYFNQATFNIFSFKSTESRRLGRKMLYDYLSDINCDPEDLSAIKKSDAKMIQQEKALSFSRVLTSMNNKDRIYHYNLSYKELSRFISYGEVPEDMSPRMRDQERETTDLTELKLSYRSALSSENESEENINKLNLGLVKTSTQSNKINFFYVSDLLEIILHNIDKTLEELSNISVNEGAEMFNYLKSLRLNAGNVEIRVTDKEMAKHLLSEEAAVEIRKLKKARQQFRKLRIVLGPIEIKDPFDASQTHTCTIGDIPISMNYFTSFLGRKMIDKQEIFYPVTNFIKDLTNELIRNFLNTDSCFSFSTKQKIKLNSAAITAYNRKENITGTDDISYFIRSNKTTFGVGNVFNLANPMARKIKPVLEVAGPSRVPIITPYIGSEMNYYVFYAGRSTPTGKMNGDFYEDLEQGIFHYVLGADRGMLKNISLSRSDQNGLKEVRFEKEGFDGLTQLREVYNASIDLYLNPHSFPGTYVFIDPRGFSPESGVEYTKFGIGGYYMITRSETSISAGDASTKLVAKWVADTGGAYIDNSDNIEEAPKQTKCAVINEVRKETALDRFADKMVINSASELWKATPYGVLYNAQTTYLEEDGE